LILEEIVHLLKHFFYTLTDAVTLFIESGNGGLSLGGEKGLELKLLAEGGSLGLGFGAGFALLLNDLYGAEDFLL
jgi:hypothetical protein